MVAAGESHGREVVVNASRCRFRCLSETTFGEVTPPVLKFRLDFREVGTGALGHDVGIPGLKG